MIDTTKRLTMDHPQNAFQTALNLFYAKGGEAWVRGGGPAPDYADVPLFDYIRSTVKNLALSPHLFEGVDNETLAEIMTEWLFDGHETVEGIVATLYTAAWAFAEIRARLKQYEDTNLSPKEIQKVISQRSAMAALADSYKAEIPQWISVTERLPEPGTRVLVSIGAVFEAFIDDEGKWQRYYSSPLSEVLGEPTHWMPLPEPPAEVTP